MVVFCCVILWGRVCDSQDRPPSLVVKGSSLWVGLMKLSSCSALLYAVVRTLKHDSLIMDTHCVCVCVCVCARMRVFECVCVPSSACGCTRELWTSGRRPSLRELPFPRDMLNLPFIWKLTTAIGLLFCSSLSPSISLRFLNRVQV